MNKNSGRDAANASSATSVSKPPRKLHDRLFSAIFGVIKGAVIGTGSILPGISGGVLSVVLGVYYPLMQLLANPAKQIKLKWKFFLPVLIGLIAGILGLSRLVDWLFRVVPTPSIWLFVGLIAGTLPSLFKEAGAKGRDTRSLISMIIAFVFMMTWMLTLQSSGSAAVEPNFWWWLLCGILWGLGIIVPGMSPSSFFIFMGLYQPMTAGIADMNMSVLIPMGLGILICVVAFVKLINVILKKYNSIFMHAIFGIVLASTVCIIPIETANIVDILVYAACFIGGAAVALVMGKYSAKLNTGDEEDE